MRQVQKLYSISEAAQQLGISSETLRRWERSGRIKVGRTPTGNRVFSQKDVENLKEAFSANGQREVRQLNDLQTDSQNKLLLDAHQIPSKNTPGGTIQDSFRVKPPRPNFKILFFILVFLLSNFVTIYTLYQYSPVPKVLGTKTQNIGLDIKQKIGDFILYFISDRLKFPSISRVNVPEGITVNGDNIFIGSSFGTTTINNNLSVQGTSTLSDLSVLGFLDVIGPTTLTTLRVTGSTTLGSSLVLSGSSTSIYNSTPNSSLSIDAGGTGAINIGNSSTGDILLAGGSDHTGCTITNSNGSLNCSSNITTQQDLVVNGGNISSSATTANIFNSQTTVNLGTTNIARTVNIGTGTAADTINIGTGGTTADTINIGGLSGTNITITGNVNITGPITGTSTIQGTRLISTIATGTAPLTVASTTQVDNLNANFVGGLSSTSINSMQQPNLVLNSDFGRRNKWMTFMPETFSDTAGWTAVTGSLGSVSSNILTAGTTGAWNIRAGLSTWRDARFSAQMKITSTNGLRYGVAKFVDANNFVAAVYSGDGNFYLIKNISGTLTQLATTPQAFSAGTWAWIELEAQGTTYIAKLYDNTVSPVADKNTRTVLKTLTATVSDNAVTEGYIGLWSEAGVNAAAVFGGVSSGDGGVYVEGWGPESWQVNFTGTKGGQAIGLDESTDAGPIGKQWAMRAYIPAASRGMVVYNPHAATAAYPVVPSTVYSLSMYEKVSGLGGSGALLWYEGRSFTSAGALAANDYSINDSGETSYTQKTSTVTLGSTAKTEDFYIGINYQNSTDTVKSATGTLFFDLPQFEQGSIATPWRNAPADDGPIVWYLPLLVGNPIVTTLAEVDPGQTSGNLFIPWDATIVAEHQVQGVLGNTGTSRSRIRVDGADLTATGYQAELGATAPITTQIGARIPVRTATGKHRYSLWAEQITASSFQVLGAAGVSYMTVTANRGKFDLAEEYSVNDLSIEGGDVISLSQSGGTLINKTTKGYQQDILGIVSTDPNIVLGNTLNDGGTIDTSTTRYTTGTNLRPVALQGRVPVKVTSENGPIRRGDILTSSEKYPGFAMKATRAGRSIGIAMDDFTPDLTNTEVQTGKILTFVNLSFYDPQVYLTDSGELSIVKKTESTQLANLNSNNLIEQTPTYQVQTTQTKEVIERTGGYNNLFVANLKVGSLDVSEINSPLLKDLQLRLSTLELATQSGVLGVSDKQSSSSAIFNTLSVLGRTVLNDLGITGNVSIGTLSIDGTTSSINSLSDTLYLQNNLLGGINILNGKVLIDKDGNITVQNNISAKKYYVDTADNKATSLGKGTLLNGQTAVIIFTSAVSTESAIFVTPEVTIDVPLSVTDKILGQSFKVETSKPVEKDVKFSWWIVN